MREAVSWWNLSSLETNLRQETARHVTIFKTAYKHLKTTIITLQILNLWLELFKLFILFSGFENI